MTAAPSIVHTLPHVMPACANARVALFAIRRIGAHGLSDAPAANALLNTFGLGFRRPLVLLRAFMHEMAASATMPIQIAPCCCRRMTPAESALLTVLARAETAPDTANLLLADLLGLRRPDAILATATAITRAFADAGRPIGG